MKTIIKGPNAINNRRISNSFLPKLHFWVEQSRALGYPYFGDLSSTTRMICGQVTYRFPAPTGSDTAGGELPKPGEGFRQVRDFDDIPLSRAEWGFGGELGELVVRVR